MDLKTTVAKNKQSEVQAATEIEVTKLGDTAYITAHGKEIPVTVSNFLRENKAVSAEQPYEAKLDIKNAVIFARFSDICVKSGVTVKWRYAKSLDEQDGKFIGENTAYADIAQILGMHEKEYYDTYKDYSYNNKLTKLMIACANVVSESGKIQTELVGQDLSGFAKSLAEMTKLVFACLPDSNTRNTFIEALVPDDTK